MRQLHIKIPYFFLRFWDIWLCFWGLSFLNEEYFPPLSNWFAALVPTALFILFVYALLFEGFHGSKNVSDQKKEMRHKLLTYVVVLGLCFLSATTFELGVIDIGTIYIIAFPLAIIWNMTVYDFIDKWSYYKKQPLVILLIVTASLLGYGIPAIMSYLLIGYQVNVIGSGDLLNPLVWPHLFVLLSGILVYTKDMAYRMRVSGFTAFLNTKH